MINSNIKIQGYDLLGRNGQDGIRFAWSYLQKNTIIESASFVNRSKTVNDNVCGYTTSVSAGCLLKAMKSPCLFCRTGILLPFKGPLTYYDIAKQNVFMVLADLSCKDHKELYNKKREFAYMGQGEPGFAYTQVRMAIELTNKVMKKLGQKVYRHILSTSGIPEAIVAFKQDLKNYYTERVTLHISLHATKYRDYVMPINKFYSYTEVLKAASDIYSISGDKPCIGIMLFKDFIPQKGEFGYTNNFNEVKQILSEINPDQYRISLCEFNSSNDVCSSQIYDRNEIEVILSYAKKKGYDIKFFSSFGKKEQTACGMLAGKNPDYSASEKFEMLDKQAEQLIYDCI